MKDVSLTLELCPYGFPIRVELDGGRARVLVDDGNGWDEAGEARIVGGPSVAKAATDQESRFRRVG